MFTIVPDVLNRQPSTTICSATEPRGKIGKHRPTQVQSGHLDARASQGQGNPPVADPILEHSLRPNGERSVVAHVRLTAGVAPPVVRGVGVMGEGPDIARTPEAREVSHW